MRARLQIFAMFLGAAMVLGGCSSSKMTSTVRTPVEQALITRSASLSISEPSFHALAGQSFHVISDEVESPDKPALISMVRQRLLEGGMNQAQNLESADILVYPRAMFSGIDESETFIGIPEVPVPIPGVGSLSSPEIALYKRTTQRGRNEIPMYGVHRQTGELAFEVVESPVSLYYTRWKLLFLFSFRTTNLGEPF